MTALARWGTLLEPLDDPADAERIADAHSVAGLLSPVAPVIGRRPFRAPHHTVAAAAVTGHWGTIDGERAAARPGELSLADEGVLYLDRVEEWDGSSLEAVAAAWRHGEVRLARGGLSSRFTPIAGVADAERAARATAPDGPLGGIVQLRIDASEDQRDNHAGGRWSTGQAAKRVARAIKRQRQRENVTQRRTRHVRGSRDDPRLEHRREGATCRRAGQERRRARRSDGGGADGGRHARQRNDHRATRRDRSNAVRGQGKGLVEPKTEGGQQATVGSREAGMERSECGRHAPLAQLPRTRGEALIGDVLLEPVPDPSPRVRGLLRSHHRSADGPGLIPACAGEAVDPVEQQALATGPSPRAE